MTKKLIMLFGLLLCLTSISFAQNQDANIKGKITDEANEPVIGAPVSLLQNGNIIKRVLTDIEGDYLIGPVSPGTYSLTVHALGYPDHTVNGISLTSGLTYYQNVKLKDEAIIQGKEIVITADPRIKRDKTQTENTKTGDEIKRLPITTSSQILGSTANTTSSSSGASIRGSRGNGTVVYVDGRRVATGGVPNIPLGAIDQFSVISGGLPAEYGDLTGGVINIVTRGPSKYYYGGLDVVTSQFIDPFGYNKLEGNLSGPLIIKNKENPDSSRSILGFFAAGSINHRKVDDPPATYLYIVDNDVLESLKQNPISPSPLGSGFVPNAAFITKDQMVRTRVRPNTNNLNYSYNGKLDFSPVPSVSLVAGISGDYVNRNAMVYSFSMFNYENNPQVIGRNIGGYLRFRQQLVEPTLDKNVTISNAYYTIQLDYNRSNQIVQDEDMQDNYFQYGYVGKFYRNLERAYIHMSRNDHESNYLVGYRENGVRFVPGSINPILANYTQQFYNQTGGDVFSYSQIQSNGGLLNGQSPEIIYSLWNGIGTNYGTYQKSQGELFNLNASGVATIKNHSFKFGIQYEQRVSRFYSLGSTGLWTLGRQLANSHLTQLDTANPIPVYDEAGNFQDTINYNFQIKPGSQTTFDKNFRNYLISKGARDSEGRLINEQSYINIDEYDPDEFNLNMFSASDLLNNGNSLVSYYGYDYLGRKVKGKPTLKDFLDPEKRINGAYNPIYVAGYIQDKFEFRDLIFNVGLRIDRFDANQLVLRDPYSLYPIKQVSELRSEGINGNPVTIPGNIGDDYSVYVDDAINPTKIVGFRLNDRWYDANGQELTDPSILAEASSSGSIEPYLVNEEKKNKSEIQITEGSFKDYEPQWSFMPRVSFSFPISEQAVFYANYNVLTQRPQNGIVGTLDDYYYIQARSTQAIANPALKPEKRTNYEVGFNQKVGKNSAFGIQAFYGEIKDLIQFVQLNGAYPQSYTTFSNIDFGTVKGFNFNYDFYRPSPSGIQFNTIYTLQFADGTGSDAGTAAGLISAGQPNLRTPFPLDYDVRHQITSSFDFRFGQGPAYLGPVNKDGDQWLKNMGINLVINTRSGTPYTRQSNITSGVQIGVASRTSMMGTINGSRLPWQFSADGRIDKDFMIQRKSDPNAPGQNLQKRPMYLNVYLMVNNILNSKNIVSVYRYTGLPNDDAYLTSAEGQKEAEIQINKQAFIDQYSVKMSNPDNFTQPRFLRLGASLNF